MIRLLRIENLGIIRNCIVEFGEGFNVITGESGSGKSLIVKAINLISGERADRRLVHPEGDVLKVEAVVEAPWIAGKLEEVGIPCDGEILVRRMIDRSGRSRAFINDTLVTTGKLKELLGCIFEVQGQRESVKLLDPSYQLELLDSYGGLKDKVKEYERLYQSYLEVKRQLEELEAQRQEIARRMDYLEFVVREIEEVSPTVGEEEALKEEREILLNAEAIREGCLKAAELLYESEASAYSLISFALKELEGIRHPEVERLLDRLNSVASELQDVVMELKGLEGSIELSPERLEEIESRLSAYEKLKMKYGKSVEDVLSFYEGAKKELEELKKRAFSKEELEAKLSQLEGKVLSKARKLSEMRREAGKLLSNAVAAELEELGFGSSRFEVDVRERELGPKGADRVEFLFSANPDVPLKPLREIASGGELSRVLLALKSVLVSHEEVSVVIFDEVDAGVGGETALLVGRKLRTLGEKRQVVAISHFPQVARFAHHHIKVEKVLKEGKTFVKVTPIMGKEREKELEKMAGVLNGED